MKSTQAQVEDCIAEWANDEGIGFDATTRLSNKLAALTAAAEVGEQRAERLRLELEKIAWMDEFLDADGAKAMMNIAREAINNDN